MSEKTTDITTLAYINGQQMSVIYNSKSIWLKLCKCVYIYKYIRSCVCVWALRLFISIFNFALGIIYISLLVAVF